MTDVRLLDDEEFGLLTSEEQDRYLDLLAAEGEAWTLSPKQQTAEDLSHEVDWLLYGGSAGGGKSDWLLWHVLHLSLEQAGHQALVLRSSFPELRRTLIRRSIALYAKLPADERPVWRAADKEWRFPNGSIIEFGYCESDDDVRQYLSAEYDCIALDEATEFTEYQANMLRSRCRTTARKRKRGIRPHMVCCSNPGGRGHKWVKETFVDPTDGQDTPGRTATLTTRLDDGRETSRTIGFVPATAYDNPHIDPAYIESLLALPDALRKQYLEGSWDSFEGMYFEEFSRELVLEDGRQVPWHVVPTFDVPDHWPRVRGMDYGYVDPTAVVWLTTDPDSGLLYVYRELKQSKLTIPEQATVVNQRTRGEKIQYTMLDPSCWQKDGAGKNIAQQYNAHKLHCRKADNRRIAGWIRLREYLAPVELETPDGKVAAPGLRIMACCPELISEMALAMRDPNNPEDLDKSPHNDHLLDALRYALMAQPPRARNPVGVKVDRAVERLRKYEDRLLTRKKRSRSKIPVH